jgi:hypothetical protein
MRIAESSLLICRFSLIRGEGIVVVILISVAGKSLNQKYFFFLPVWIVIIDRCLISVTAPVILMIIRRITFLEFSKISYKKMIFYF